MKKITLLLACAAIAGWSFATEPVSEAMQKNLLRQQVTQTKAKKSQEIDKQKREALKLNKQREMQLRQTKAEAEKHAPKHEVPAIMTKTEQARANHQAEVAKREGQELRNNIVQAASMRKAPARVAEPETLCDSTITTRQTDGKILEKQIYTYDEDNRNVETLRITMVSADENGNEIDVEELNKTVYEYGENTQKTIESYYDAKTDTWVITRTEEYRYNDRHYTIYYEGWYWSDEKEALEPSEKVVSDYDEHDNQILRETYSWDSEAEAWIGNYKNTNAYEYDAEGNVSYNSSRAYYWNSELGAWEGSWGNDNTYGENSRDIVEYSWDAEAADWYVSYKSEHKYDEAGNTIYDKSWFYSSEDQAWHPNYFSEYAYDERGNQTMSLYYSWSEEDNDWVPSNKFLTAYDENNNRIDEESYNWDFELKALVPTSRSEYFREGRYYKESQYRWDSSKQEWYLTYMFESDQDENGNITLSRGMSWNEYEGMLWGNWYYKNEYDDANRQTLSENYAFNKEDGWYLENREISAYDSEGRRTNYESYYYAYDINKLVGSWKETCEYKEDGEQISYGSYHWNLDAMDWAVNQQWTKTYENGLLVKYEEVQDCDYNTPGCEYTDIHVYIYDEQGRLVNHTYTTEYYPNEDWGWTDSGAGTQQYSTIEQDGLRIEVCDYYSGEDFWKSEREYYNAANNLVKTERWENRYVYNPEEGTYDIVLMPVEVFEYEHDANGNVTSIAHHYIDGEDWVNGEKQLFAYDENGNQTMIAYAEYNEELGDYVVVNKNIHEYDANGKMTKDEYVEFDLDGNCVYGGKNEYAYDEAGHQIYDAYFYWGSYIQDGQEYNNCWVPSGYNEFAFDEYGNQILNASYYYQLDEAGNLVKVGSYKDEYRYDANGNQIMNTSYYWDSERKDWRGGYRSECIVDEQGNVIAWPYIYWDENAWKWSGSCYITLYDNDRWAGNESYHLEDNEWVGDTKYYYLSDENWRTIFWGNYTWNKESKDWMCVESGEYTYREDGNIDRYNLYVVPEGASEIALYSIQQYYYSVHGEVGVSSINAVDGETVIYRLNGMKVQGNPTPGIYIVNGQKTIIR